MDERERNVKISPEIYVYATNKNFLNIYDALRIDKVKIEIAGYDPASNKQTGIASAWLDADDLRLVIHLVTSRQFKDVLDRGRFEKFGGSERDGEVESRTLMLEWDPGEGGRFARFPYRLTISNGPGTRTQNGAVQPKGEPASKLSMRLPEADLMKILLAVEAYVQAYESAHHHRLVAQKVRELQQKLAERGVRPAGRMPAAVEPEADEQRPAAAAAAPARTAAPAAAPGLRVVGRHEVQAEREPAGERRAPEPRRSTPAATLQHGSGGALRPTGSATGRAGR